MKNPKLASGFTALSLAVGLFGCSGQETDTATGPMAIGEQPACAADYWSWLNHTYLPLLDRPATEVSPEDLAKAAAAAPNSGENKYTFSACWQPAFDQYVFAPSATRLTAAATNFKDQKSPDYLSLDRYQASATMTDELRRNAAAILALRPKTASRTDMDTALTAYTTVANLAIAPVGLPGLNAYTNVVEPEWVVDDAEAEYLDVLARGLPTVTEDGAYGSWMGEFNSYVFGPDPIGLSFVFNLPGEPAYGDNYGLTGVEIVHGSPVIPTPVRAFLDRFEAIRPAPVGAIDSADWMNQYNGRMLKALADRVQMEPVLDATDDLELATLEEVKPSALMGLFTYQTWINLYQVALSVNDAALTARVANTQPCVAASDLAAATTSYDMAAPMMTASADVIASAAPAVCSTPSP